MSSGRSRLTALFAVSLFFTFAASASAAGGGSISGTVTGESANPLGGICAVGYDASGRYTSDDRTEPDGTYSLEGLDAGDYRVQFQDCGSNDVLSEFYNDKPDLGTADPVTVAADTEVAGIDAELATGGWISGRITDSLGDPANPICVYSSRVGGIGGSGTASTDGSGNYTIRGLETGNYRLQFDNCGNQSTVGEFYNDKSSLAAADPIAVTAGSGTEGIDAELALGGSISGTVTDDMGDPLHGLCVRSFDSDDEYTSFTQTDASGDYTINGLATDSYRLQFYDCSGSFDVVGEFYENSKSLAAADPVAVTEGITVSGIDAELTTGGSVSGTVTDTLGQPLENVCVEAFDSEGDSVARGYTSGDGSYRVSRMDTGSYLLEFRDCGRNNLLTEFYNDKKRLSAADPVEVTAGSETSGADAELAPGGSISGMVTDGSGDPVPVCVTVYDPDGREVASTRTYGGEYSVSGLDTGSYRLKFSGRCGGTNVVTEFYNDSSRFATANPVAVTAGSKTVGIDVEMASGAGGSISGRVTDGSGNPLAGVCVTAYDSGGHESGGPAYAYGNYMIPGLPAGNYRVGFSSCDEENFAYEFYDDKATLSAADQVAVSEDSDTPGIDAQLDPGASISGTLTDSLGEPVDDFCANAYDSSGRQVGSGRSRSSGEYTIEGLRSGSYHVGFFNCGKRGGNFAYEFYDDKATLSAADPVAATAGSDTADIDAQLAEGGSISGRVAELSGDGFADICISVFGSDGDRVGSVETNFRGDYRIEGLRSGSYRLRYFDCGENSVYDEFYNDKKTLETANEVVVNAGSDTSGINVVPDRIVYRAKISKVKVKGPARVKKGKKAKYKVKITNSGNLQADGVRLKVKGKGVSVITSIGKMAAGKTRTARLKLRPKKPGKVKLTFKVTSSNAGGKSVRKKIAVRK